MWTVVFSPISASSPSKHAIQVLHSRHSDAFPLYQRDGRVECLHFAFLDWLFCLNDKMIYQKEMNRITRFFMIPVDKVERIGWMMAAVLTTAVCSAQEKYLFAEEIAPLVTAEWAQWYPYSRYCPTVLIDSSEQHVYAGCAPLAMSQLMHATRSVSRCELLGRSYDWQLMPNRIDTAQAEEQKAVARLIRDCGIAALTNYQQTASSTKLNEVVAGMKKYFGMSRYMHVVDKSRMKGKAGKRLWNDWIFQELKAGRPVMIRGQKGKNFAHVFLIDGCKDSTVHVNFGWGGKRNGYYDPDTLYGFTQNQRMVIGAAANGWQPRIRRVICEKAGQLHLQISDADWQTLHHLKVSGLINAQDIALLRQLAGGGRKGERSGQLATIDLSETALIAMPDSAFFGCATLTYLSLPKMLPELSAYAVANCPLLNEVTVHPVLNRIRRGAFLGCFCLTGIQLPNSLDNIDANAFNSCTRLTDVELPQSVLTIGSGAFANCKRLKRLVVGRNTKTAANIISNTQVKQLTRR